MSERASDFTVGQRVTLSHHAHISGIRWRSRARGYGTVTATKPPFSVRVRPDTYKTDRWYHAAFLEAV